MAKPLVKYAGGKAQLIPQLLKYVPNSIGTYYEPFIGGGALFFELAKRERFYDAVIADANPELVEVYTAVRDSVEEVITQLKIHARLHSKNHYYKTRDLEPFTLQTLLSPQRAARMIYLNKMGFNGLHRQNKRGRNNVPIGDQKPSAIFNEANVRAVSKLIRYQIKIMACDFTQAVSIIGPGDFVYFDPPYLPREGSNDFTAYTGAGFDFEDHKRLAETAARLVRDGVTVVASNSSAKACLDLYPAPFKIHRVKAKRSINSDATKRGPVTEIIAVGIPS